ncbi:hypothetical protein JI667_22545, partial [Bacillus sp. NTK074B]|nr:hypothetical protein [Bacillus sp. NTK074B]
VLAALALGAVVILASVLVYRTMAKGIGRAVALTITIVVGFFVYRAVLDPAVDAIEGVNTAAEGYLGGMGLPIVLSWAV